MAAAGADLEGRELDGRYRVESKLGEGGMGAVYLALDLRMVRHVVVKVPHPRLLDDPGFRERFEREVRSLTVLEHPHIVKALDVGSVDGTPYAVLQYLSGRSLADRLAAAGGRQAPGEILAWLPGVAAALDFVHRRQAVHRDVKPGNVLFDEAGHAYLADFGIVKALGTADTGLTQTGITPGSPGYMAPEIAIGATVGPAYDQYALAVIVYEALSGALPHAADSPFAVVLLKQTKPAPFLAEVAPHVGPEVARVVARALERDPAQRFSSCSAFAEAFALAVARPAAMSPATHVVGAPKDPAVAGPREPVGRRAGPGARVGGPSSSRRLWVGGSALGLLLGLGAVMLVLHDRGAEEGGRNRGASPLETARSDTAPPKPEAPAEPVAAASAPSPPPAEPGAIAAPAAAPGQPPPAAAFQAPLTEALSAAVQDDWERARTRLADARAAGASDTDVPAVLRDGLARYDAPPTLTVESPSDGAEIVGPRARVKGRLVSGRARDLLEVGGTAAPLTGGAFDAEVLLPGYGPQRITLVVRDGNTERARRVLSVTVKKEAWRDFLEGWAEPVGAAIDAATGYPLRVKRVKDMGEMVLVTGRTQRLRWPEWVQPAASGGEGKNEEHHLDVPVRTFYVDVCEVTNRQFSAFANATRHRTTSEREGGGFDVNAWEDDQSTVSWRRPFKADPPGSTWSDEPVVNVTPSDAEAFARWVGARLPTAAEWTVSATTPENPDLPESVPTGTENMGWDGADRFPRLAPARSFPANPLGLHDILGNVAEIATPSIPLPRLRDAKYVHIGWAWNDCSRSLCWAPPGKVVHPAFPMDEKGYINTIGFRCARSLP